MVGPLAHYEAAIAARDIVPDDSQSRAVAALQRLFDEMDPGVRAAPGLLTKWFRPRTPPVIKGLYLWGGVGRGKTYLMDVFFDSLPFSEKKRLHFHRFMRLVHREMRGLQGEKDPLRRVAEKFAAESRIICFDEFFVSDITDAMILANLLETLFARGVVLVATSNAAPDDLYRDGLQRSKFLPAIALIKQHTQVMNVDGSNDYRLRALKQAEIYHAPLDQQAEANMERSFLAIAPDAGKQNVALDIEDRPIAARRCADGVVWFRFEEICDGPRSQNDYIELAHQFQTVLISGVPRFDERRENLARRFISLVDEFYDRNVKLILSAEVPLRELYAGTLLGFEFQRTESRLLEMQSEEYLSREHKP